ncbi:MAG: metalloregulator ArsR/SmtB family transcription factor [Phycisphaerales bacterium]|jgi:DNA-binding transcriptional ArsR family regulator
MASLSHKPSPASPRQAARRRAAVDGLLDPELFKALADPTRVLLLRCLLKCRRGCSVSEVAECCDVDFSVVARHLSLLARAGVLEARKEGRTVWYTPRCAYLGETFRALADAIDECAPTPAACCGSDCCEEV